MKCGQPIQISTPYFVFLFHFSLTFSCCILRMVQVLSPLSLFLLSSLPLFIPPLASGRTFTLFLSFRPQIWRKSHYISPLSLLFFSHLAFCLLFLYLQTPPPSLPSHSAPLREQLYIDTWKIKVCVSLSLSILLFPLTPALFDLWMKLVFFAEYLLCHFADW